MDPEHRPPILDMTPEGEFRDPPQPTGFDALLARVGGMASLVTGIAGTMLAVALAVLFIGVLIPVVVVAGLIAFGAYWWRVKRGKGGRSPVRFVVIRR